MSARRWCPICAAARGASARAVLAYARAAGGAEPEYDRRVVRAACDRAGLPRVGAHRLRHTAATEMLRQGASLAEIGQVLRHREHKTTAIYAKVDRIACVRSRARGRGGAGMTALQEALDDYLRDPPPARLRDPQDGRLLEGFVEFLERAGAERVTTELALVGEATGGRAPALLAPAASVVRGFARYLATIDPASEVPSVDLLPAIAPRIAPYIYSERGDHGADGGRTGGCARRCARRVRDADRAACGHRDAPRRSARARPPRRRSRHGTLHVRAGKQNKQREMPLHKTTIRALRDYARLRDAVSPSPRRRRSSSPAEDDA